MAQDPITRDGLRSGAIEILPAALATLAFGLAFGVYAAQHGLSFGLAFFMNTAMAAGTAQFAATALWHEPLPWLAMIAAAVAVNLRFTLMSATLRPYWNAVPAWRAYVSFFFLYDANWAQLMRRHVDRRAEGGYLLSSGVVMYALWMVGMIAGYRLGVLVAEPQRFGIDFILPAFLATTTASLWRTRSDFLPLVVAALVAVLCRRYVSAEFYILAGALAGSVAVFVRQPRRVAVPLEHVGLVALLALSTYACRAGGYVAMRFVRLTPRVRQWLGALPLAVMGAFLAPIALEGGVAETAGLAATVVATRLSDNSLSATLVGVGVVAALRAVLP